MSDDGRFKRYNRLFVEERFSDGGVDINQGMTDRAMGNLGLPQVAASWQQVPPHDDL